MNEKDKTILLFGICGVYAVTCALLGIKQYWWFTVLWFPVGVILAYSRPVVNRWLKTLGYILFSGFGCHFGRNDDSALFQRQYGICIDDGRRNYCVICVGALFNVIFGEIFVQSGHICWSDIP